jgi:hypothetical protein
MWGLDEFYTDGIIVYSNLWDNDQVKKRFRSIGVFPKYFIRYYTPEDAETKNFDIEINKTDKKTKIIFFSTDKIYSNNYKLLNSSKFIPRTFLASEKLKSENYIRNATKMFFILRLPIVHSDGFNKNLSTVDYFLNSLRNGEKISVFDNIKRSFLEVNELVYFLKSLIQNNNYGTYNIGSKLFFYSDRIKILSKKYKIYKKKKIILIRGDIKPDIQYFDISKTQKIFNKFFY